MQIDQHDSLHLTYCTNVHDGETWPEVFANIKKYCLPLKNSLAPDKPFGIGLRLSNNVANELLKNNELTRFKDWLSVNGLYVFTINGFPYGGFHHQRVKEQVYAPDWMLEERRDYCLNLIKILTELTTQGNESGFSTSPLSYKPWLQGNKNKIEDVYQHACIYFSEIVAEMVKIHKNTGKMIHIDIEAEPDCLIETVDELVYFFQDWLMPVAASHLAKILNITHEEAKEHIHNHIRACYDICHSSVEFEKPNYVFKKLSEANILIGKVQISTALKSQLPNDVNLRKNLALHLKQFIDPVYLHQVVAHAKDGKLFHYVDLDDALKNIYLLQLDELRTHFHVPIFLKNYKSLSSTQDDVISVLKLLQENDITHHLEIETYTWDVLPNDLKTDLFSSLKREYEWVLDQFEYV